MLTFNAKIHENFHDFIFVCIQYEENSGLYHTTVNKHPLINAITVILNRLGENQHNIDINYLLVSHGEVLGGGSTQLFIPRGY